jgi:hypothetical protein
LDGIIAPKAEHLSAALLQPQVDHEQSHRKLLFSAKVQGHYVTMCFGFKEGPCMAKMQMRWV